MFCVPGRTKTYYDAEKSPTVLCYRREAGFPYLPSLGLTHLCGDADNKPIQGCHDHRCAADNHEERDKDRVLKRELDYEIPVVQRVVYNVQRVANLRRVLVEVIELQLDVNDTLRAGVQLIVGDC